jgi:hypothetical protein
MTDLVSGAIPQAAMPAHPGGTKMSTQIPRAQPRWWHRRATEATRLVPVLVAAALVVAAAMPAPASAAAFDPGPAKQGPLALGPIDQILTSALKALDGNRLVSSKTATSTSTVTVPAPVPATPPAAVPPTKPLAAPASTVDLRVLVLATKGDPNPDGIHSAAGDWDYDLSTLTQALDYVGVPYDVYKSSTRQLCTNGTWKFDWAANAGATDTTCSSGLVTSWTDGLTSAHLSDGGTHAFYQGVMQTNGTLSYADASGAFVGSALTSAEWSALWTYEGQFAIRTVSANTFPTADFGLTSVGADGNATNATYTAAGKAAFPYVNGSGTLPITNSYTYRATTVPTDATTKVLLTDAAGDALAVTHSYPTQGNREALALTFNSAGYLTHGQVLGYGLVNWVTKGLFLGERHALLDPQPDDVFIEDSTWPVTTPCGTNIEDPTLPTYRITGSDLSAFANWQTAKHAQPTSQAVTAELPFNGEGAKTGIFSFDSLTLTARLLQSQFKWINHTYDHTNLDAVDAATAKSLIAKNNTVATQLGLQKYSKANLIQPDISGLNNPAFLQAAVDSGLKYIVSDTSRTGNPGPNGPNEGHYNTIQPSLLEVARYPVNLYFNVGTPQQWLAEDNCIYPAGAPFGHVDTYAQLLDRESTVLLKYLLRGDNRPLMFHQTNLKAYDGKHSLLSDLMDATLVKYNNLVTVPLISPTHDQIGVRQAARMKYNDAWKNGGLSASVVPGTSITLTSQKAVTVPITGLTIVPAANTSVEDYAGQHITYVTLAAGQTVTLLLG